MTEIINKVESSGIIVIDPADFFSPELMAHWDLADGLFQGLLLREKDFRAWLNDFPTAQFKGKWVRLFCSQDAIIPMWAYMLMAVKLSGSAEKALVLDEKAFNAAVVTAQLEKKDWSVYNDKRVVIKGCGNTPIPEDVYLQLSLNLIPRVKSLMFGEPCSTVPVYKAPKNQSV